LVPSAFRCSFAPRPLSIYIKQKESTLDSINRVLWADDDKEDIFLFSSTLKELQVKIDCHFLPNGKELISFIATSGAPKLIILDLNMPLMDGHETLKFLKSSETYAHIPVVIFTTSHNAKDMNECKALGAEDYFIKPNSYMLLRDTISKMLDKYQLG